MKYGAEQLTCLLAGTEVTTPLAETSATEYDQIYDLTICYKIHFNIILSSNFLVTRLVILHILEKGKNKQSCIHLNKYVETTRILEPTANGVPQNLARSVYSCFRS
jgi:hypothetical protein